MKIGQMHCRFEMIFGKSTIARISLLISLDREAEKIILDFHGLSCREAERFTHNIVNVTRGGCLIEGIHGYRKRTRIKDMLQPRSLEFLQRSRGFFLLRLRL